MCLVLPSFMCVQYSMERHVQIPLCLHSNICHEVTAVFPCELHVWSSYGLGMANCRRHCNYSQLLTMTLDIRKLLRIRSHNRLSHQHQCGSCRLVFQVKYYISSTSPPVVFPSRHIRQHGLSKQAEEGNRQAVIQQLSPSYTR